MAHALQAYFKKPQTIIAIVIAIAFQLIFSAIWMTAYDGVTERVDNFQIALVNQDKTTGVMIEKQLVGKLPFKVITLDQHEAQRQLDGRDVQMIVRIPEDFSQQLQTSGVKASLVYTINESNAASIKSIMQTVATTITEMVNKNIATQGTQAVLEQLQMPSAQATGTAQSLVGKVESEMIYTHPVNGMNNQMVPLMLVLASFVGSMIMAQNLHQSTLLLAGTLSKWNSFRTRLVINFISAPLISFIGSVMVLVLGGQMEHGFLALWMFQMLLILAFMFFSQMFINVLGMSGMIINIVMMSLQLVTSGAMVPRLILNNFYKWLGEFLPATYGVQGIMALQFGGPGIGSSVWGLIIITVICLLVSLLAVALKKEKVSMVIHQEGNIPVSVASQP